MRLDRHTAWERTPWHATQRAAWEVLRRAVSKTSEWRGRPYTTAGGKNSHVRVQRVNQPGVTEVKLWGSYEKVSVKRA